MVKQGDVGIGREEHIYTLRLADVLLSFGCMIYNPSLVNLDGGLEHALLGFV